MNDLPEGYTDAVYINSDIHLDWKDRIKVLFGYKFTFKTITYCEHPPGKLMTESKIGIYRPRPIPKGWGYVEVGEPKTGETKQRTPILAKSITEQNKRPLTLN